MMMGALALVMALASGQAPLVLAVGVNRAARTELPTLQYADDDAAAAAELFGAPPGRTWLLATLDADSQQRFAGLTSQARPGTLAQLRLAVSEVAAAVATERAAGALPVVLVWLVGHGAFGADGQPYVAMEDGELTAPMLTTQVLQPLADAHRVHVVLDACHAGAMVQWRAAVEKASVDEVLSQPFMQQVMPPGNAGLITAAAAHQKTFEWEEMRAGIFSALTRAGLRGAANANGDDCVTYDEVAAYVSAALKGIALPEARPRVVTRAPAVDNRAALSCQGWFVGASVFSGADSGLGSFQVRDDRGVWLTGGHFEPGHQPGLWLSDANGLALNNADGERALRLQADGTLAMAPEAVSEGARMRGAVDRAVREGLFRVPFGPAFLQGYTAAQPEAARATPTRERQPSQPASHARHWLLLGLPAMAGAAALGVGVALAGALLGTWALQQYVQTDLQRPAAFAAAGWAAGWGGGGTGLVVTLASCATSAVLVAAWLLWR